MSWEYLSDSLSRDITTKNDMVLFEFTPVNGYTHPSLKIKFAPLVNWI